MTDEVVTERIETGAGVPQRERRVSYGRGGMGNMRMDPFFSRHSLPRHNFRLCDGVGG
jgi:hypothetical protein